MKSTTLLGLLAVVIIIGGIAWAANRDDSYETPASTTDSQSQYGDASSTMPMGSSGGVDVSGSVGVSGSSSDSQSVTIANFAFSPATLTVKKGTTVTWTNQDSAPHNVRGTNGGPSSETLAKGQSYSFTFTTAGTFPYICSIHPNMKATVIVTE